MTRKLCVLPNDPLAAYLKKGEIKERYFNPKNIFDEIHVISLFDSDEKEENVKEFAGKAKLKIHVLGKINLLNKKNYIKSAPEILCIFRNINSYHEKVHCIIVWHYYYYSSFSTKSIQPHSTAAKNYTPKRYVYC